jgi:FkbM family methyltransferase
MLEVLAATVALTLAVVAFYLRRGAHYSDALERQVGELRQQIGLERQRDAGMRESINRLMASQQEMLKLREDVQGIQAVADDLRAALARKEKEAGAMRQLLTVLTANYETVRRQIVALKEMPGEIRSSTTAHQSPLDCRNAPETGIVETEMAGAAILHPVFRRFKRYRGPGRKGFIPFDFLGSFVCEDYIGAKASYSPCVATDYPAVNEDIFAWIDLLEAVVGARKVFHMMELGASYGCWSARGALAAFQLGLDVELTCVEPEPEHFRWIEPHMLANSIPLSSVRSIHAALADKPGHLLLCVDSPSLENCNAGNWHGQAIAHPEDEVVESSGTYHGVPLLTMKSGYKTIEVPAITLDAVLCSEEVIDIIHCDVQNAELGVFSAAMDSVDRLVKRVNIGTHSTTSEEGLRVLFDARGWECLADYSLAGERQTPYGTFHFQDGVQSWRNPKLAGL